MAHEFWQAANKFVIRRTYFSSLFFGGIKIQIIGEIELQLFAFLASFSWQTNFGEIDF